MYVCVYRDYQKQLKVRSCRTRDLRVYGYLCDTVLRLCLLASSLPYFTVSSSALFLVASSDHLGSIKKKKPQFPGRSGISVHHQMFKSWTREYTVVCTLIYVEDLLYPLIARIAVKVLTWFTDQWLTEYSAGISCVFLFNV